MFSIFFFFQAEDGIRDYKVTGVQTCALPICFQASKNLNAGEGGAVLTNNDEVAEICRSFHNQGRARPGASQQLGYSGTRGSNLRLSEFQGNLLLVQMTRLEEQSKRRTANAEYLTRMLKEIPG